MKSWHLHAVTTPQNFMKVSLHLKLLHFLTLNRPTNEYAFGWFDGFSYVWSHKKKTKKKKHESILLTCDGGWVYALSK